jgi:peptidoglycan/LPS O-acetylase OafA/YrhL
MMATVTPPELIAVAPITVSSATGVARPSPKRSVPALDGLRSLGRISIVFGHALKGHYRFTDVLFNRLGDVGVSVFFVISGYLITGLLVRDAKRSDTVHLGRFYLRRTLRIFPPFFAYLAIIAIIEGAGILPRPANAQWWPALTYTSNLFYTHDWLTAHSWTLAIEEQFYIIWPIVFTLCVWRRGTTRAVQLGAWLVVAAIVISPLARVLAFALTKNGSLTSGLTFDFVAAGSGLALLEEADMLRRPQRVLLAMRQSKLMPFVGVLVVLLHLVFSGAHHWMFAFDIIVVVPTEAVLLSLFIGWCIHNPNDVMGRVLNFRPLRVVAIGSYSLYLWQQMFLGPDAPVHWPLPIALLALCACSAASYWLIERPSVWIRDVVSNAVGFQRKTSSAVETQVAM